MTTISTELPLFLQEGGEKKLDDLRKELKTFLDLINNGHAVRLIPEMTVMLEPDTRNAEYVGQREAEEITEWFGKMDTKKAINDAIFRNDHKIDGKDWSAGFLGSRWMDRTINGRRCRFAFYSKTHNPTTFNGAPEGKRYLILIDPTN
jgi:hypothetical protein